MRVTGRVERPPLQAEAQAIEVEVVFDDRGVRGGEQAGGHDGACGRGGPIAQPGDAGECDAASVREAVEARGEPLRPGIVHRLDRETSGLVIIAKTDFAHRKLAEQFQRRTVEKKYIALVQGTVERRAGHD